MGRRRTVVASDVILFGLAVLSGTSFAAVMDTRDVVLVAALGAAIGAVVAVSARRYSLLNTEAIAISVLAMIVIGGFIAGGGLPDWPRFFRSITRGWADLLTTTPPVLSRGKFLVLPFVISAVASIVGFAITRQIRVPGLAAIAPVALFGVAILFGVEQRGLSLTLGTSMLALALVLGWLEQRRFGSDSDETIGATTELRRRKRFVSAVLMVAGSALLAPLLSPLVPGFDQRERFNLRDRLDPPERPLDRASPLIELKNNYVGDDPVLFEVRGDRIPSRLRLASLGTYNGEHWTIGDPTIGGRAPFSPIDRSLPSDPRTPAWESATDFAAIGELTITRTEHHRGPWLPVPADPRWVEFSTDEPLMFNPYASMLADPKETSTLTYVVAGSVTVATLDDVRSATSAQVFARAEDTAVVGEPGDRIKTWAADFIQSEVGTDSASEFGTLAEVEALRRMQAAFRSELPELAATGLDREDTPPGHSWGRLFEMVDQPQVVGFEEQFASLGALTANWRGIHARVVVGYELATEGQGRVEIRARDASAWVEVLTNDQGWIAIDVTPDDEVDTAPPEQPNPSIATAPQDIPDPVEFESAPPRDRRDEDPDTEACTGEECEPEPDSGPGLATPILVAGGAVSILLLPVLFILGLKHVVQRRRRNAPDPDHRISGAWLEANDRLIELGDHPEPRTTVFERAETIDLTDGEAQQSFTALATLVDRSAFGPADAQGTDADSAWDLYGEFSGALDADTSTTRRWKRRLSLAPWRSRIGR